MSIYDEKTCKICGNKFKIKTYKACRRKYCYDCSTEGREGDYTPLYLAMKKQIIKERGGKCERCGYNKSTWALQFHHINQDEKEFELSCKSGSCNWEKFKKEAEKCMVLCANCHAEIHEEMNIKNKEEKEKLRNIKNKEKKQFEKYEKEYRCIICNKEISNNSKYCKSCYIDMIKKSSKSNKLNREELKYLIRNFSFLEIGRKFGVSDNAVRKWCKKENLPHKASEIKKYSDEEW